MKRILFVMDPLARLDHEWDTSLCLLRELSRRGHRSWAADVNDLWFTANTVHALAREVQPLPQSKYQESEAKTFPATHFDLILIRKEPPFDSSYLYLTYLLELVTESILVLNHPRGIRNYNEKLGILRFPAWCPETMVSKQTDQILAFQNQIQDDVVLKPLHLKGGEGVTRLKYRDSNAQPIIHRLTHGGNEFIMAQRFLIDKDSAADRRLILIQGEIVTAYTKQPVPGDFRGNLCLGATAQKTEVTPKERQMVLELKPFLLQEGLQFVALDIIADKIIEINVTCPAGLPDAEIIYPELKLVAAWADSLEALLDAQKDQKLQR